MMTGRRHRCWRQVVTQHYDPELPAPLLAQLHHFRIIRIYVLSGCLQWRILGHRPVYTSWL
jgi:hypothetical protein